jgi:hypothetical protein
MSSEFFIVFSCRLPLTRKSYLLRKLNSFYRSPRVLPKKINLVKLRFSLPRALKTRGKRVLSGEHNLVWVEDYLHVAQVASDEVCQGAKKENDVSECNNFNRV